MHSLSGTFNLRLLAILVAVLIVLALLTTFLLLSMHPGTMPMLVQSTESILD